MYNPVLQELLEKEKTAPIFLTSDISPEDDLSYRDEQRQMSEILLDMHAVNNGIIETKNIIDDSINTLAGSVASIMESVRKQQEQAMNLNILCGNDSAYSSVIPVFVPDFEETDAEVLNERTVGAAAVHDVALQYDIVSISGNGYSGNDFVYKDGAFENETDDRSNMEYLMDENDTTVYEYSRLSTRNKQEAINGLINYDDKEVECTITLLSQQKACSLRIDSFDTNLIVRKLETSNDGAVFTSQLNRDIAINDISQSYTDASYTYGSSVLCFPYSSYIRVTFVSKTILPDTIAIRNEDDTIREIPAYRRKIALNGLRLYRTEYEECVLTSRDMLQGNAVDKVSLFATEYIPDHFPEKEYIQYFLIVNGKEVPVVPANTGKDGVRIIKYSEESGTLDDTVYLVHETIKSIIVKIVIDPLQGQETPYIANLKLCVGKDTGNIYV